MTEINRVVLKKRHNCKVVHQRNRTYDVATCRINYYTGVSSIKKQFDGKIPARLVWKGEWDILGTRPICESRVYKSFRNHFKEKKNWEETIYYDYLINEKNYKCNKHEKVLNYLNEYDNIYQDINTNGYNNKCSIKVVITRNGEYIIWDGKHRVIISKLLGLKNVPVQIRAIHSDWFELRQRFHNGSLSENDFVKFRNHPDLQDILK